MKRMIALSDISSEELKVCQATDPSLRSVRIAVKEWDYSLEMDFFSRDGLFYRRWAAIEMRLWWNN